MPTMGQPKTQNDQRRSLVLVDQFNRRWFVTVEIATGDPTGSITKVGGWKDPLKTPQQYVTVPHGDTLMGQWRVMIDFPNWIDQQEREETEWALRARRAYMAIYRKLDADDLPHLENDVMVRDAVGRKPWPSSLVLKAARDGDRQYLGLAALDNDHRNALGLPVIDAGKRVAEAPAMVDAPKAAGIPAPPENYKDFVSWAFQYGGAKNIAEAAAQWQTHRKLVEATA